VTHVSPELVVHACPACGNTVRGGYFKDNLSGVVYHATCFLGSAMAGAPSRSAGYRATVTQAEPLRAATVVEAPAPLPVHPVARRAAA
jgi:hypothetical protein